MVDGRPKGYVLAVAIDKDLNETGDGDVSREDAPGGYKGKEKAVVAFADAIVEWIVADDQASFNLFALTIITHAPIVYQCHRKSTASGFVQATSLGAPR